MFLVWKNHGRRQRLFEAKNTQKLQRVRKLGGKNKPKKQKKNNKNIVFSIVFCYNFFVFHSISFSFASHVARCQSCQPCKSQEETRKGSEVIRKNKMKKETKRFLFFVLFFCYNFFVFQPISMFLVSKSHTRRPRFFEAKNTQKLQRVWKI